MSSNNYNKQKKKKIIHSKFIIKKFLIILFNLYTNIYICKYSSENSGDDKINILI